MNRKFLIFWRWFLQCRLKKHFNLNFDFLLSVQVALVFLVDISIMITPLTVTIFSVERYVAVSNPFWAAREVNRSDLSRVIKIIILMWITGLIVTFFQTFIYKKNCTLIFLVFNGLVPILVITTMSILTAIRLKKLEKAIKSNNEITARSKRRAFKLIGKFLIFDDFYIKIF